MAEFKNLTICSNAYGISNSTSSYVPSLKLSNDSNNIFILASSSNRTATITFPTNAGTGTFANPINLATVDYGYRSSNPSTVVSDWLVNTDGANALPVYKAYNIANNNFTDAEYDSTYRDYCMRVQTNGSVQMEIHAGRVPTEGLSGHSFAIHPSAGFKWIVAAHFTPTMTIGEGSISNYNAALNSGDGYNGSSDPFANSIVSYSGPVGGYSNFGTGPVSRLALRSCQYTSSGYMILETAPIQSGPYTGTSDAYYLVILTNNSGT